MKGTFATVQYSNQEIREIAKLQKEKHTSQFKVKVNLVYFKHLLETCDDFFGGFWGAKMLKRE